MYLSINRLIFCGNIFYKFRFQYKKRFTFAPVLMDPREKLLIATHEVFMRHGIKSMTMDDVAREIGISKKTLYQYVTDKSDLVMQITQMVLRRREEKVCQIFGQYPNAIEEMIQIFNLVAHEFRKTTPTIFNDLKKYYPESWQLFREHKKRFITAQMKTNMESGIVQGLYRADINTEIITMVYLEAIEALTDQHKFMPETIPLAEAYKTFIIYHLRGIASSAGLIYINQRFNEIV